MVQGMKAWRGTLKGSVTTCLPSDEFIGCALQGATGLDTLKWRPKPSRYSVWDPKVIRCKGKYHNGPTLRKYLVKIPQFTSGLPSENIFRVWATGGYRA